MIIIQGEGIENYKFSAVEFVLGAKVPSQISH